MSSRVSRLHAIGSFKYDNRPYNMVVYEHEVSGLLYLRDGHGIWRRLSQRELVLFEKKETRA